MGMVNILSMLGTYTVIKKYDAPEVVIFSVSIVSVLIFGIGTLIIKGVEQIVKIDRFRSEFVSIASHQLKAPLSGIRWSIDLLLNDKLGELNEKQKGYLNDISENTTRMIRLVNDLLDVSRIESNHMEMNLTKVSLVEIVEDVVDELNNFAQANNVKITTKIDKDTSNVRTDPRRIKMVIQNLIDNAIKYTRQSKGIVEIGLKNKNGNVCCTVKDNGVGIPKSEQKKVFEKFFRGSGVTERQTIGTGLGLYIAKASIENSNGKIGFISKENKGSTFWFTLPAVEK